MARPGHAANDSSQQRLTTRPCSQADADALGDQECLSVPVKRQELDRVAANAVAVDRQIERQDHRKQQVQRSAHDTGRDAYKTGCLSRQSKRAASEIYHGRQGSAQPTGKLWVSCH